MSTLCKLGDVKDVYGTVNVTIEVPARSSTIDALTFWRAGRRHVDMSFQDLMHFDQFVDVLSQARNQWPT
jgi:hypothetical protein